MARKTLYIGRVLLEELLAATYAEWENNILSITEDNEALADMFEETEASGNEIVITHDGCDYAFEWESE